jgi:hypothetical protein
MLQHLTEKLLHHLLHAADRNDKVQWVPLDDVAREEGRVIPPGFSGWRRLELLLNARVETDATGRLH